MIVSMTAATRAPVYVVIVARDGQQSFPLFLLLVRPEAYNKRQFVPRTDSSQNGALLWRRERDGGSDGQKKKREKYEFSVNGKN